MLHLFLGRTRSLHIQFLRYLFVGGSSAVLDILIYVILMQVYGMNYLLAAFVAYMIGLSWNYVISLLWVFESKHNRGRELIMILFIAMGGLFWTELLLYFAVEFGGYDALISKIVVLWIVLVWNFGMRKLYVFH